MKKLRLTKSIIFRSFFFKTTFISLLIANSLYASGQYVSLDLTLNTSTAKNLMVTGPGTTGEYVFTSTTADPHLDTNPIPFYDADTVYVLEFQYFALSKVVGFQVFVGSTGSTKIDLPVAESWNTFTINLKKDVSGWNSSYHPIIRLDIGSTIGQVVQMRNLKLRMMTQAEYAIWQRSLDKAANYARLDQVVTLYNNTIFRNVVSSVKADKNSITISGTKLTTPSIQYLCEVRMHQFGFDISQFDTVMVLPEGTNVSKTVNRFSPLTTGGFYDRIYSRWVICQLVNGQYIKMSKLHWVDEMSKVAIYDVAPEKPINKKGMGGVGGNDYSDLVALGAKSITYNLVLSSVLATNSTISHTFNGKTYYINATTIANLDNNLKSLTSNNIIVSLILLIPPSMSSVFSALVHPNCNGGSYSLANVEEATGVEYYTAIIDYLAKRYSNPNKTYGRITNWILHNEIDAATVWTNAGDLGQSLYIEEYMRSMRCVYYTARKYNPTSRVFISLTHHWQEIHTYKTPDLLYALTQASKNEGDFEWGVAYHSYPLNLFEPKTWLDDTSQCTSNAATALYITPRNLELIDQWARNPSNLYKGTKVRSVLLSENGINTKKPITAATQHDQAAGVAYFLKKLEGLPSVEMIAYHRWIDHQSEGGLLMGLWQSNANNIKTTKKESWQVFADFKTANENTTFDKYKLDIGITDWSKIYNPVITSSVTPYAINFIVKNQDLLLSGIKVAYNDISITTNNLGVALFTDMASSLGTITFTITLSDGTQIYKDVTIDGDKTVNIDINLSTVSSIPENQFELFPNPTSDFVTLNLGAEPSELNIYNSNGLKVFSMTDVKDKISIPTSKIGQIGLYCIKVNNTTKKLIIIK